MKNAATSDSGDGVNESTRLLPSPVLAGSGSAGLWLSPHSQRTRRSPEAVFGCAWMVHRASVRPAIPGPAALDRRSRGDASSEHLDPCSTRVPGGRPMRRVFLVLAAAMLAFGLAAPAVLAAQPTFEHRGTVLMSFNGDVTVPADESADSVFAAPGRATTPGP